MSPSRTIAFATCTKFPDSPEDDQLALRSLRDLGLEAVPAVWDSPSVDWSRFDLVVLRSTWDYFTKPSEFREWVDRVGRVSRLLNSPAMVHWNSHKRYLVELAERGTRVPPTVLVEPADRRALAEIAHENGWARVVVKPAIGGNAYRLRVFDSGEFEEGTSALRELQRSGTALVQPFLTGAGRRGERSLVYFDGQFSHAVEYANVLNQPNRSPRPVEVPVVERVSAERILGELPEVPLYARFDYLPDENTGWFLGELELIEPELFLRSGPHLADRFASAILSRLSGAVRGK
ncbi:MAG TPA: hypothetical protein VEY07_02950 [Thermoplasmata archaeon]|nr:hypothetical protein [Thermoplasmata archaeon]